MTVCPWCRVEVAVQMGEEGIRGTYCSGCGTWMRDGETWTRGRGDWTEWSRVEEGCLVVREGVEK